MTKDDMIKKVRRAINEPDPDNSIVDNIEIYDYLYDGATIFIRETACMTEFAENTTMADTQEYTFADWVLKPEIVLWNNGSKWVELDYKTVRQLLKITDFQLFTKTGNPENYFIARRQIHLSPIPEVNGSANDIMMLCSKMPEVLTLGTDEWDELEETYQITILHYAKFECWDKRKDEIQSKKHYELFYAGIDNYKEKEQEKVKGGTYQKKIWTPAQGFVSRL